MRLLGELPIGRAKDSLHSRLEHEIEITVASTLLNGLGNIDDRLGGGRNFRRFFGYLVFEGLKL